MSTGSLFRRAARLVFALVLLPASACDTASVWLTGINRDNYTWEKATEAPVNAWVKDLAACEGPGGEAPGVGAAAPTIRRSEDAAVVQRCMNEKGYYKVYQARTGVL
jgi:hypothetical protein